MGNTLDPTQHAQFNNLHPRAFGGKFGQKLTPDPRPPQPVAEPEDEVAPDSSGDTGEETASDSAEAGESVRVGNNEGDALQATTAAHAKHLRGKPVTTPRMGKSEPTVSRGAKEYSRQTRVRKALAPELICVFEDRASATKYAIACDAALGNDAHTRVTAAPNGKYHVGPVDLNAEQVAELQALIAARTPLSEIGRVNADERKCLEKAAGAMTEEKLPALAVIAKACAAVSGLEKPDFLSVLEAVYYGGLDGVALVAAMGGENGDRARAVLDAALLGKGMAMARKLLLMAVPDNEVVHDSMENDGATLPVGSHESVDAPVGEKETITEATAKYPRPGHKQKRRPRLILRGV